jgi:hypothetical protein
MMAGVGLGLAELAVKLVEAAEAGGPPLIWVDEGLFSLLPQASKVKDINSQTNNKVVSFMVE